jgi:hypothetical protein
MLHGASNRRESSMTNAGLEPITSFSESSELVLLYIILKLKSIHGTTKTNLHKL